MRNFGYHVMLAGLMLTVAVTTASAAVVAPEISPSSLSAGLALLAGGVLLVRARMRK